MHKALFLLVGILIIAGGVALSHLREADLGIDGETPSSYVLADELAESAREAWASFPADPIHSFRVSVRLKPILSALLLEWEYAAKRFEQDVPLDFHPTVLCAGETFGRFYVGGTTARGVTKVVALEFSLPELDSITDDIIAPGAMSRNVTLLEVPPSSQPKEPFALVRNRGKAGGLFLETYAPNAIYDLDTTNGVASLAVPAEDMPELQHPYHRVYQREHAELGYVYFFVSETYISKGGTPLFFDKDKDGVLDEYGLFDRAAWKAAGLSDSALYRD